MVYTRKELADAYGHSISTFNRHVKKLSKRRKNGFKRTSLGNNYNAKDAFRLSLLMNFNLPSKKNGHEPKP